VTVGHLEIIIAKKEETAKGQVKWQGDAWTVFRLVGNYHMSGVLWLIITGSGWNDWIYWHFFRITINYTSSRPMAA
jgi:hypothetical protein